MIWVTRLDGSKVMVNEDRITVLEPHHDTLIRLDNGECLRVEESCDVIAERIADWQQRAMGLSMLRASELAGPESGSE